jgi:hypothetical protein
MAFRGKGDSNEIRDSGIGDGGVDLAPALTEFT